MIRQLQLHQIFFLLMQKYTRKFYIFGSFSALGSHLVAWIRKELLTSSLPQNGFVLASFYLTTLKLY